MSYENEKRAPPDLRALPEDAIPKIDPSLAQKIQEEEDAHLGVKTVEAAERVYGRYTKWLLFVGLVPLYLRAPHRVHILTMPPCDSI